MHAFSRFEMLVGPQAITKLAQSRVAVFGIGGVGTYAVEGLARAGLGHFSLIDDDTICLTNINRQIHATHKTIGRSKVEVMKERILDINPDAHVTTYHLFYSPESAEKMFVEPYDYVVDAIDNVTGKVDLALRSLQLNIPIISSMGTGNKFDPTQLEIADIYATSVCPLAKVMRKLLKKAGVERLQVVYSKESPVTPLDSDHYSCKSNCVCPDNGSKHCTVRHKVPGSASFVPSVAGLIIASEIVRNLIALKADPQDFSPV